MNQEAMLTEILNALKLHGKQMDERFVEMENRFTTMDNRLAEMDAKFEKRFDEVDARFDRLEKKVDGIRADLTETQETTDFLLSKTAQHEKKLRNL